MGNLLCGLSVFFVGLRHTVGAQKHKKVLHIQVIYYYYVDSNSRVFNIEMREWPGNEAMLIRVHFAMYTVIVLR